jgi:hypothetical protein
MADNVRHGRVGHVSDFRTRIFAPAAPSVAHTAFRRLSHGSIAHFWWWQRLGMPFWI